MKYFFVDRKKIRKYEFSNFFNINKNIFRKSFLEVEKVSK